MFGVSVDDIGARLFLENGVAQRLHQMRLAETDPSVDKEWIIGSAGFLSYLYGKGSRELVGAPFHEGIESESWLEAGRLLLRCAGYGAGWSSERRCGCNVRLIAAVADAAYLHDNVRNLQFVNSAENVFDTLGEILIHPISNE